MALTDCLWCNRPLHDGLGKGVLSGYVAKPSVRKGKGLGRVVCGAVKRLCRVWSAKTRVRVPREIFIYRVNLCSDSLTVFHNLI